LYGVHTEDRYENRLKAEAETRYLSADSCHISLKYRVFSKRLKEDCMFWRRRVWRC